MKLFYTFLLLCSSLLAFAQGESRENPIRVDASMTSNLLGQADANTTTWFLVPAEAFGSERNLLTVTVKGGNYGDIVVNPVNDPDASRFVFLKAEPTVTFKYLWTATLGDLLVSISQDNAGGTVSFDITKALAGETRQNAIPAVEGNNAFPQDAAQQAWFSYTASQDTLVVLSGTSVLDNITNIDGLIMATRSGVADGFRMRPGETYYFLLSNTGNPFTLRFAPIPIGLYSDRPEDITGKSLFHLAIPADPNATKDGAEQSERYWLYRADQGGLLMWGTDDAEWTSGMWGVSVTDQTTGRRLGTPLTAIQAGMVTYTISVEAGHDYLIAQTIGHGKARQASVYLSFTAGQEGDSKDNPITLTLGQETDLGRVASTTRYYLFTALQEGVYTATIHAGGQVRATTPRDGSWNIGRDYSIQDRHMHIDDNIPLAQGETLLLEVTLTSDIDFHTNGQDASIPNYSILITRNGDQPAQQLREGEDMAHAIQAQPETPYAIGLNADDDNYPRYYAIEVPAGATLYVCTSHPEAISSPSCISFTLDDVHWSTSALGITDSFLLSDDGSKKVGRQYVMQPTDEPRRLYLYVEGVSFLYEGASWFYTLQTEEEEVPDALDRLAVKGGDTYTLTGMKVSQPQRPGLYLRAGRKVVLK